MNFIAGSPQFMGVIEPGITVAALSCVVLAKANKICITPAIKWSIAESANVKMFT